MVQFNTGILSLLIFCWNDISKRYIEVLKSHTIIVSEPMCLCIFSRVCLMKLGAQLHSSYICVIILCC
jgi:hypothetical protein